VDLQPAYVILDAANYRKRVGELTKQDGLADVCIERLVDLLRQRGYVPTGCAVAMPTQVVTRQPQPFGESDAQRARLSEELTRKVEKSRVWFKREADWLLQNASKMNLGFRSLELLRGGLDSGGEVGVDDLIVAKALIVAAEIQKDAQRAGEQILVLSHDTDLLHIAQYTGNVEVLLVGTHTEGKRPDKGFNRPQIGLIELSDQELKYLDATQPAPASFGSGKPTRKPPAIAKAKKPVDSTVAVVVDAYGLTCEGATALGISELPNVESVRNVLTDIGLAKSPAAVRSIMFVVPDIFAEVEPRPGGKQLADLPKAERKKWSAERRAWEHRDKQLDGLAVNVGYDNDDGTNVVRSELVPAHLRTNGRRNLAMHDVLQQVKRYSTYITAAVLWECLYSTANDVVIFTDNPDVLLALEYVLTQKSDLIGEKRLLRIGLRAEPLSVPETRTALSLPYLVLTSGRLVDLFRLTGPSSRELRRIIADADTETVKGEWVVVGYEPEVGGVRARSRTRPDVQAIVLNPRLFSKGPGAEFSGDTEHMQVIVDPRRPLSSLMLGPRDANAAELRHARVVRRDASGIAIDWDDDGHEDAWVPLDHDLEAVESGSGVVIGTVGNGGHQFVYFTDDHSHTRQPGRTERRALVLAERDRQRGTISIDVDGRTFGGYPIQGASLAGLRSGDSIVVVDVGSPGAPHYVVISNGLADCPVFRFERGQTS
jgi:hypothetical protein